MDKVAERKCFQKFSALLGITFLACILISCSSSERKKIKSPQPIENTFIEAEVPEKEASQKTIDETPIKSETVKEQVPVEMKQVVQEKEQKPFLQAIAPFGKHEDRYQVLFDSLLKYGMQLERIITIFTSERAQQIDNTAIKIMSRSVVSKPSVRTKRQASDIAKKLKKHLDLYKQYYDYIENTFGVNREIAAAILFKETRLGEFKNWKHDAFTVLNSLLSFLEMPDEAEEQQKARIERIIATVQKSLAGLLLYCEKYDIDITKKKFHSSFAGAIGFPQFLPMHMDHTLSIDNKTPDLSHMPDAIISLGNLLKNKFGWPGFMDFNKLEDIDVIIEAYVEYDIKEQGVSFCMSTNLDGYPLRRFVDDYNAIPNIEYIVQFASSLMNYNYSSDYVLDVLQFAFHAHKLD